MPKFKLRANAYFTDAETGKPVMQYNIVETRSRERMLKLINTGLAELVEACHEKQGNRIMIHQSFVGVTAGGINTANKHIAKAFADKNLAFIVDKKDMPTATELAKYCDVIIDERSSRYECDVFIMSNYNTASIILPRVKARKVYTLIHADFGGLKRMAGWQNLSWRPCERCDKVLAVSETAQKGLETAFGVESVIVPNILTPLDTNRKVFIVLSRVSKEKGMDRVIELYDRFLAAGKDFCFYICNEMLDSGLANEIEKRKRIVHINSSAYNQDLIRGADYLVQLSRNESYCYSIREALQRQVPVIVSDIPEFNKIVKDGYNGFILNDDFSNLDVEKIFNSKLKFKPYTEQIPDVWYKVLGGEI